MAKVWKERFRDVEPRLAHIRIILCETAVGNDIPLDIARAAVKYDAILGYHPYTVCRVGKLTVPNDDTVDSGINRPSFVSPHDWRWYSGRWNWMDERFRAAGVLVDWAFGEMGPVLDASETWSGHLDPLGGWKNDDCLNGNVFHYRDVVRYWLDNVTLTHAYQTDRIISAQLFTTGAPGGPDAQWGNFELEGYDMRAVMDAIVEYDYPPHAVTPPPVQPPVPPVTPPEPTCEPRTQYRREYWALRDDISRKSYLDICSEAFDKKITVGFSYDDAGLGKLDDKTAVLFDIDKDDADNYEAWFAQHYPATKLQWEVSAWIPEMKMPLEGNPYITQHFGENCEKYMKLYGIQGHNGTDFGVAIGTPVLAALSGRIILKGFDPEGYGTYAVVFHDRGLFTLYAHLSIILQLQGDYVEQGDTIGLSGNSGFSSGPHLHFGVEHLDVYIDPESVLRGVEGA